MLCFALFSAAFAAHHCDPLVVGQTFMAGSTDPTAGSTAWALASHGISEKLFTVNKDGEIVPQVAESCSNVDDLTWEVTLKSGYKFSDGTAVDAEHVAACLTELNTVNSAASSTLGAMTVTASGDLKVRIVSERSTHVMDAVLAEWVFAVYKKDGDDFVFTGPYAVEKFVDGDHIDLVPNEHYPRAIERPDIVLKKYAGGDALAAAAKSLEIDLGFHLPVAALSDLRKAKGVHVKSFEVGYHYMMHHNMARPNMGDVGVRKAIDVAIDRNALSQSLGAGMGTRSLFPDYTPYFLDESDPHGDANAAAALLDAAGWALEGGKRMKDGQELTIKLVAYPQRPGLVTMQPVIADALTAVGITVESVVTSADSWDELDTIMADGDFDLLMWAQNTLPAGDPAWFLNAFFRSDGGNNFAGLDSADVDSLLDALSTAEKHGARVAATAAAHSAILAEVPISNLVTPVWHVSVSDRLIDYEPWGSDYYVIRAEGMPLTPASRGFEGCDDEEDEHDDHDHDHDDDEDEDEDEKDPVSDSDSFAAALSFAALALNA